MELSVKKSQSKFNKFATNYQQARFLQYEVGQRLMQRMQYCKLQPDLVLDLGAGAGNMAPGLQQLYPAATMVFLDLSKNMLRQFNVENRVQANALSLPFAEHSFDLICANLVLHWTNDIPQFFAECKRVLTKNGLLLFTTMGPQTLIELKLAFQAIDKFQHVHDFIDIIDLGNLLLAQQFVDPVIDQEKIIYQYHNLNNLYQELKIMGVSNSALNKSSGLYTRSIFSLLEDNYKQIGNYFPATFQVLYGHALKR